MMKVRPSGRNLIHHPMSHAPSVALHRKRWALSQDELAHLLGVSQANVSRIEDPKTAKSVKLEAILGLEVVFGHAPRTLFTALFTAIEDAVIRRAAELDTALRDKHDPESIKKKQLLIVMLKRVSRDSRST